MSKISFVFMAGTLLTILAAGSVLMSFMSVSTENINHEAAQTVANLSSTFLETLIFIIILTAVILILTGRKLPL